MWCQTFKVLTHITYWLFHQKNSNSCGQLGQSYQDYHCSDEEAHMECPVDPNMEITAVTHAKWWGAPGPLMCGPKSKYPVTGELGVCMVVVDEQLNLYSC